MQDFRHGHEGFGGDRAVELDCDQHFGQGAVLADFHSVFERQSHDPGGNFSPPGGGDGRHALARFGLLQGGGDLSLRPFLRVQGAQRVVLGLSGAVIVVKVYHWHGFRIVALKGTPVSRKSRENFSMSTTDIGLFKALNAKMAYLDHRQKIIAQNVANADTPDYRPEDLTPLDFGGVLKNLGVDGGVRLETTRPGHMPMPGAVTGGRDGEQKVTYEVAPAENAVVLEEQMMKASRTSMDYTMVASLYQKDVNMIRTALGTRTA